MTKESVTRTRREKAAMSICMTRAKSEGWRRVWKTRLSGMLWNSRRASKSKQTLRSWVFRFLPKFTTQNIRWKGNLNMRDKDSRYKRNMKFKSSRDFKLASYNKHANPNCSKNPAYKNSLQSRNRPSTLWPTVNSRVGANKNQSQNLDKNCKWVWNQVRTTNISLCSQPRPKPSLPNTTNHATSNSSRWSKYSKAPSWSWNIRSATSLRNAYKRNSPSWRQN